MKYNIKMKQKTENTKKTEKKLKKNRVRKPVNFLFVQSRFM